MIETTEGLRVLSGRKFGCNSHVLEFLRQNIGRPNLRSGDKVLLGASELRLRNFAVDETSPSGLIFEPIKDPKRRRSDLEREPSSCGSFSLEERKCGLQKAFYLSYLAWSGLQRHR